MTDLWTPRRQRSGARSGTETVRAEIEAILIARRS
jgi:hypothetical protein